MLVWQNVLRRCVVCRNFKQVMVSEAGELQEE